MNVSAMNGAPQPTKAILVYDGLRGGGFATLHSVEMRNNRPVVLPGTPVTRFGLIGALEKLKPETALTLLPANVLASGDGCLVWYSVPQRRKLFFRCDDLGGEFAKEVPLPGLVWMVRRGTLFLFAYSSNGRPEPTTPLCWAPLFNIWDTGEVCVGNADVPAGASAARATAWESMFFDSAFTHPNMGRLVKGRQGALEFTRWLLDGKRKVFPQAKLLPTGHTLEATFSRIFKGEKQ